MVYTKVYEEENITCLKFEVRDLTGDTEKMELLIYKEKVEEHYLFL